MSDRLWRLGWWKIAVVVALCGVVYLGYREVADHQDHSSVLASGTIHGKHWVLDATNDCSENLCGMLCLQFNAAARDALQGCGFGDCDGCDGVMTADTMDSFARRLVVGPAPKGTVKVVIEKACLKDASTSDDYSAERIVGAVGVRRLPDWAAHHGMWWMYETGPGECDIEPAYFLSASGKHLKFGSA